MKEPLSIPDLQKVIAVVRKLKPDWRHVGSINTPGVDAFTDNGYQITIEHEMTCYAGGADHTLSFRISERGQRGTWVCNEHYKSSPHWVYEPDQEHFDVLKSFLDECLAEFKRLEQARKDARAKKEETARSKFLTE